MFSRLSAWRNFFSFFTGGFFPFDPIALYKLKQKIVEWILIQKY